MTDHTHLWELPEPVRYSIGLPRVEFLRQGPFECTCGVSAWLVDGRSSATWSNESHRTETKTWPCMLPLVVNGFRHVGGPCTLARRNRPERTAWDRSAEFASKRALVAQPIPYLVAHPEREIAVVRWIGRHPYVLCRACNIDTGIGLTEYGTEGWAERHNLALHPRRFARLSREGMTTTTDPYPNYQPSLEEQTMPEYAYDPEFPYVVAWGHYAPARFAAGESGKSNAERYAKETAGRVIDTTPKPKIPADSEYIYWRDEDDQPYFARKDKTTNLWETDEGFLNAVGNLVDEIGDAEVTVLVPKEES